VLGEEGSIDRMLTVWEDRQWVTQLLNGLPPAQREAMALIVDEYSPTEIAQLLGASPEAVRQRLYVARQRLENEINHARSNEYPTQPEGGM
jgi:RNA polymerase sigma factor (sigma-70 family)